MINYLSLFIPHLATLLVLLNKMTGEQSIFDWTPLCNTSFNKVKLIFIKAIKLLDYKLAKRKKDLHLIYSITDTSLIGRSIDWLRTHFEWTQTSSLSFKKIQSSTRKLWHLVWEVTSNYWCTRALQRHALRY